MGTVEGRHGDAPNAPTGRGVVPAGRVTEHTSERFGDGSRDPLTTLPPRASGCDVDVVIVEDHVVLAESLAMTLRLRGLTALIVDVETSRPVAIEGIRDADPGVVLLDLNLGTAADGVVLIPPLVQEGIHVLVLTGSQDPIRHGQCLAAGADGVLPKSATIHDIVQTIHDVMQGRDPLDAHRTAGLVRKWHSHSARQREIAERFERLTERERQVLHDLVSGMRPTEIALESHVSKHTVRSQVKSILTKLGVASQLEAVSEARRSGWAVD